MGWEPGSCLGPLGTERSRRSGLLCPIEVDEHAPGARTRAGLGYYGPPCINYSIHPGQMANPVYIRTIFDNPQTVAQRSTLGLNKSLIRRDDPTRVLKYRHEPAKNTKTDQSASTSQFVPLNRTVILNAHNVLSREGISFISGGFLKPVPDWTIYLSPLDACVDTHVHMWSTTDFLPCK